LRKTIKVLEQIQRIDLEIKGIEGEQRKYRDDIDAAEVSLREFAEAVEEVSSEIDELLSQIKALDDRMAENSGKIKKDENRLNDIKNSKELNALNREISAASKGNKQNEQDKAAFSAKAAEIEAKKAAHQAGLDEKSGEFARLTSELEEKKAGWGKALEEKTRQRDAIKGDIRPDILKKYEMIRSRRGGLALAVVRDETCQGCYIHIPPQVFIQLQKGVAELIYCPHCYRILYAEDQGELEAI